MEWIFQSAKRPRTKESLRRVFRTREHESWIFRSNRIKAKRFHGPRKYSFVGFSSLPSFLFLFSAQLSNIIFFKRPPIRCEWTLMRIDGDCRLFGETVNVSNGKRENGDFHTFFMILFAYRATAREQESLVMISLESVTAYLQLRIARKLTSHDL